MSPLPLMARSAALARPLAWAGPSTVSESVSATVQAGVGLLALPFDVARAQYAHGVQAGLIECSILASRDFERALGALERLTLGPLARRV